MPPNLLIQNNKMRIKLIIISISVLLLYACKQHNCNINNYENLHWEKIDSAASVAICNNSDKEIKKDELITIEYIGELNNGKITKGLNEELLIEQLTKINFGTFNYGNSSFSYELKELIKSLKANSSMILKYDFGKNYSANTANKIDVFFTMNTDSTDHLKWINEIKNKEYIDSIAYISKEDAIKRYSEDNDTTWKRFIEANPLPSSAEVYLKQNYLDSASYYKICEELKNENVVSEVTSLNSTMRETMRKVDLLMKKTIFIKIKI